MAFGRPSKLHFFLCVLPLAVLLTVTHTSWLTALGTALVHDEGPAKADMAVVLAGDKYGNRILKGAELVRQGYVPIVLVSGPGIYNVFESDMAIAMAAQRGNPRGWFLSLPHHAESTIEEAWQVLPALEEYNVRRFLLVTSDYHTARAARIYRSAIRSSNARVEMRVVAAPDRWFRPDSWWKTREGRKIFLEEWAKTLASALGV